MSEPELFKYDVRVRERMLHRGGVSEAQIKQRLDALPDLDAECEVMVLQQPALGHPESAAAQPEAAAAEPAFAPPAPPPPVAAPQAVVPPPAIEAPEPTVEGQAGNVDDEGWGS